MCRTFCSVISETFPFVSSFGCMYACSCQFAIRGGINDSTWRMITCFGVNGNVGLDLDFMDGRDESGPFTRGHRSI